MWKSHERKVEFHGVYTPSLSVVTLMLSLTCNRGEYKLSFSELLYTILRKMSPEDVFTHTHTHTHTILNTVSLKSFRVTTPDGGERGRLLTRRPT